MQIGIDIRSVLKKRTGIGKYTVNLINAVAGFDKKNSYYLYSRKKFLDFNKHLPELPAKNFYHRVDYFKKGPDAVLPDIDIFHTSSYDLSKPKRARYIVTIHDVIIKAYPYGHSEKTIKEVDEGLKRILGEADVLVADSYCTKADLIKFYGVDGSKVRVIYPGVNFTNHEPRLSAEALAKAETTNDEKYILFVGTIEPRKNIDGLIRAFDWLKKEYGIGHKLYIVGMKGWMYEGIFKAHKESKFKRDIVFKGYVGEEELASLYRGATVFTYPSFYEGFGFPIIEAFSYGIPAVTSKTSSCGEIAGDSALLVEPSSYREIGEAIIKIINNGELRAELSRKGIDRSREFTWRNTATEFLKLFT